MARILVADRVPFMRNITRFALEYGGHEVIAEAGDGKEALDLFFRIKPDLLISEIVLPKVNGLQVLNKIREEDKDARLIICSSVSQETMIEQAMARGADSYIVKPFNIQRFLVEVNRVLGVSDIPQYHRVEEITITEQEDLENMAAKVLTKTISPEELRAFINTIRSFSQQH
jgi:two-component system chemotaxis response regulator CheY